jgi:hypothetical protein
LKSDKVSLDVQIKSLNRDVKRKVKIFWDIAYQLIRNSLAFRVAVLQKVLGKSGRWFHRDFDLEELFDIFSAYQKIADSFSSDLPMKRTWISTELRNGTFK